METKTGREERQTFHVTTDLKQQADMENPKTELGMGNEGASEHPASGSLRERQSLPSVPRFFRLQSMG